jgi:uncharacterized repeat protein (TIGR01451 family)
VAQFLDVLNKLLSEQSYIPLKGSSFVIHMTKPPLGLFSLAITFAFLAVCLCASASSARPVADVQEWQPVRDLPEALASHGAIIRGDYLYIVGGRTGDGLPTERVCAAKILRDGSLDTCKGVSALPYPLYFHAVVASLSHLYVLGGWDEQEFHKEVWRAQLLDNGNIGPWLKDRDLDDNRKLVLHDAVLIHDTYLYVIGGQNERQEIQKKVFYAKIGQAGELDEWQSAPDLPLSLDKFSAVVKDNVIYVTGGRDRNKKTRSEVYYAKVDQGKLVDPGWILAPEKLPEPREYHKVLIFDDKLVVLGGKEHISDEDEDTDRHWNSMLYASSMDANASPGGWTLLPGLVESLQRFAAVTLDRNDAHRLYILGGLHGANDYRQTTYQLVAPKPALTLTVTPQNVDGPNDRLTYVISLNSQYTLSNVTISNPIPLGVKVVPNTIHHSSRFVFTQEGSQPGEIFKGYLPGELLPNASLTISYQVEPVSTLSVNTTLTVTNQGATATWLHRGYPGQLTSNTVASSLPYFASLQLNGKLSWPIGNYAELYYTVRYTNGGYHLASPQITNFLPEGVNQLLGYEFSGQNGNCGLTQQTITCHLSELPAWAIGSVTYRVSGAQRATHIPIFNQGATLTWTDDGILAQERSNSVNNLFIFLPIINR